MPVMAKDHKQPKTKTTTASVKNAGLDELLAEREAKARRAAFHFRMFRRTLLDLLESIYLAMLGLGAIHHSVSHSVPALGFGQTALVVFTIWVVIPAGVFKLSTISNILEKGAGL